MDILDKIFRFVVTIYIMITLTAFMVNDDYQPSNVEIYLIASMTYLFVAWIRPNEKS